MIEARFTTEMRGLLKSLKGLEFVGYSATEFYEGKTVFDGKVYLHIGDSTIKVFNESKRISWFKSKDLSDLEEIFSFACIRTCEQGQQTILIKEEIEEIKIVTDYIKIPQKNYEIILDMALIVETTAHKYIISRGWFFGEYLDVLVDKNLDDEYSTMRVIEDWNNDGEWDVDVKRIVEKL